jgi:hypothetical protein
MLQHNLYGNYGRPIEKINKFLLIWYDSLDGKYVTGNGNANQGESVFRLRNFNILEFYYLFNCATCFGHTTIFKYTFS